MPNSLSSGPENVVQAAVYVSNRQGITYVFPYSGFEGERFASRCASIELSRGPVAAILNGVEG